MKTLLVGYDDSDASRRALDRAIELAQAFGSKLVVASVAPVPAAVGRGGGALDPTDPPDRHRDELAVATDHVKQAGIAAESILDIAEERSADMIIVGTHEPGLLERLLGQSTSGAVARRAHCDVLIVH
ncbi:MAG TPA: universal stress protein [Candidatus Limnocylindrales bacterium]